MAEKKPRCVQIVGRDWGGASPCLRPGVVLEDGKHWCKQHVPSAQRRRREASNAKWRAERAAREARDDRLSRIDDAEAAVVKAAEAFADSGPHNCAEQGRLRAAVEVLREARGAEVA